MALEAQRSSTGPSEQRRNSLDRIDQRAFLQDLVGSPGERGSNPCLAPARSPHIRSRFLIMISARRAATQLALRMPQSMAVRLHPVGGEGGRSGAIQPRGGSGALKP